MFWSLQTQLSCSPTVSGTLEVLRPYVSLALVSSSSCCLLIIIHSLIIMFVNRNCGRNVDFFFYKRLTAYNNRSQTSPINKVLSKSDFIWLYLILEDYWAIKISHKCYFRVGILQQVNPWLNMLDAVLASYIMVELAKWLKKVLPSRVFKIKCIVSVRDWIKRICCFICILISRLNSIFDVSEFLKLSGKTVFKKKPCWSEIPIPLILFEWLIYKILVCKY